MAEEKVENKTGEEAKDFKFKYGISTVITSFIYYNSLIRDTLEYVIQKPNYDVNAFKYKQNGIINELKIDSPLKKFLTDNADKGEKLLERLIEFGNTVYGEDSTILHLAEDGLRVDHAQHMTIIEGVITLHEEISSIIKVHMDFAKKNDQYEEIIGDLFKKDDEFYRAVVLMVLTNEFDFQFAEYNKARNEAKGEKTAASNFIEQDLGKLNGLFNFSKQYATVTDADYTSTCDEVSHLIEMMNGKRDLPEGKTFRDVFLDARKSTQGFLVKTESPWRETFGVCARALAEAVRNAQANKKA